MNNGSNGRAERSSERTETLPARIDTEARETVNWRLSPIISLMVGHSFLLGVIILFHFFGFYQNSGYFSFGPPVVFFAYEITDNSIFLCLLFTIFIHQLITNWIYEVVYPWMINTIQNPRHTIIPYPKAVCLCIINANSLYSQLHLAFLVGGITSQISFLFALVCADFITLTYINWHYLEGKIHRVANLPPGEVEMEDIV